MKSFVGQFLVLGENAKVPPAADPVETQRLAIGMDQRQLLVLLLPGDEFGEQSLQGLIGWHGLALPAPQHIGGGQLFGKKAKFGQIHRGHMPDSG